MTSPETKGSPPMIGAGYAGTSSQVPIPVNPHVELESSLNPVHSTISLTIPVGPRTQSLAMSLHSSSTGAIGPMPSLERVTLEDPEGNPVDQVGTFWGPQATDPVRDLTLSFANAPAGGNLLVEISIPTAGDPAIGSAHFQQLATPIHDGHPAARPREFLFKCRGACHRGSGPQRLAVGDRNPEHEFDERAGRGFQPGIGIQRRDSRRRRARNAREPGRSDPFRIGPGGFGRR